MAAVRMLLVHPSARARRRHQVRDWALTVVPFTVTIPAQAPSLADRVRASSPRRPRGYL